MSALAKKAPGRPVKAMVYMPGKGAGAVEVRVFQDGQGGYVVRGEGGGAHAGPNGVVEARVRCELRFPNRTAYDAAKAKAFNFNPVVYTKAIGTLGIDDDPENAEMLPEGDEWFVRGGDQDCIGRSPLLALATDNGRTPPSPRLLGLGEAEVGVRVVEARSDEAADGVDESDGA